MNDVSNWDLNDADAKATATVYRLLAEVWIQEPDRELLTKLTQPAFAEAYASVGGDLGELSEWETGTPDVDSQLVEQLACDYCQLFIGPKQPLSLHQSAWSEGRLEGAATRGVREFAQVLELPTDALPLSMPDHLGVEFWLMATIIDRIASADRESVERSALTEIAQSFFARHLTWPEPLFQQAFQRAETAFYRSLIQLTHDFLQVESDTMLNGSNS